ncbi:RabGAP/TBC domain-containing protein [Tieghemostelium lacteum]|uniref:RabGAP/TBC domain-containing protein n=1 Tax=Tieghemostelium lacteum TaxID=361077 RepID=A0A151Z9C8_TIELA|nr:RabGAP/TBC domain-containing protein [Tieghemostelium lacteum]|eukprot:KYQ90547.1 RabGAP/TBC domain-containing protein [Tieghemostelium lacteum]
MALAFPPHAIQAILEIESNLYNYRGSFIPGFSKEELTTGGTSSFVIKEQKLESKSKSRYGQFKFLLSQDVINIDSLRYLSWGGIPVEQRPLVWKLLLNYLPKEKNLHNKILFEKKNQYKQLVTQFYRNGDLQNVDKTLLNQIRLDVPRTVPKGFSSTKLIQSTILHKILERILYVWSITNPKISYFQGLNDIPAQFLLVFLSQYINLYGDLNDLNNDILEKVEADTFWCFSLLMNNLKNRFIDFHDGIQKMSIKLERLVKLKDLHLSDHLTNEGCDFILFSIRWMICLLAREFDYALSTRLWDSYIAHGPNFGYFHIYVCAALLTTKEWATYIKEKEFSDIIVFLQHLPTDNWNIYHIDYLLVRAHKIFLLEMKSMVQESFQNITDQFKLKSLKEQQEQKELEEFVNNINNSNNNNNNNSNSNNNNNNNNNNSESLDDKIKDIQSQMKIKNNQLSVNTNDDKKQKTTTTTTPQPIQLEQLKEIHQELLVSTLSNKEIISPVVMEKIIELVTFNNEINLLNIQPDDADKELVKQVTTHLIIVMGTLLLVSVVLIIVIISTSLTILALQDKLTLPKEDDNQSDDDELD